MSYALVGSPLKQNGSDLQANRRAREGAQHEVRDEQSRYNRYGDDE